MGYCCCSRLRARRPGLPRRCRCSAAGRGWAGRGLGSPHCHTASSLPPARPHCVSRPQRSQRAAVGSQSRTAPPRLPGWAGKLTQPAAVVARKAAADPLAQALHRRLPPRAAARPGLAVECGQQLGVQRFWAGAAAHHLELRHAGHGSRVCRRHREDGEPRRAGRQLWHARRLNGGTVLRPQPPCSTHRSKARCELVCTALAQQQPSPGVG